jgi:hypothetical protein
MASDAYLALMGQAPRRIPHWEHLSNPDFEQLMTRVNPWEHPRTARQKLLEQVKIDFGGYVMCIGNHIPWNIPPEAVRTYFELSKERAVRK